MRVHLTSKKKSREGIHLKSKDNSSGGKKVNRPNRN